MSIWNPFGGKTPEQELEQLLDDLTKAAGAPQQSSGTTITTTGGQVAQTHQSIFGGLTPQQLQGILSTFGTPLTKAEQDEMNQLKADHANEVKKLKLTVFKKLAPEMRQFVINAFSWNEHVRDINSANADKSPRLRELEQKENNSRMFSQSVSSHTSGYADMFAHINKGIALPEGLTVEDLKQAHIEASLEEEILDGQKEE